MIRCNHCGRSDENARAAGSLNCNPPFPVRPHLFNGCHPADKREYLSRLSTEELVAELQARKPGFNNPPWHPLSDPKEIKTLGKYLEELGECVSASARTLIQGIDEVEPLTKKPNREWLAQEMADVEASGQLVRERFRVPKLLHRIRDKINGLRAWHEGA